MYGLPLGPQTDFNNGVCNIVVFLTEVLRRRVPNLFVRVFLQP